MYKLGHCPLYSHMYIEHSLYSLSTAADTDRETLYIRIQSNLRVENCFFVSNMAIRMMATSLLLTEVTLSLPVAISLVM